MPAARARTRSRHGAVAGAALLAGAVLITLWAQATLHARVAPAAARSVPAATLRVDAHARERLLDERGLPRRQPFLAADAARGVGGSGRPARARWGCESYWDEASNASVPRCAPSGRDGATRCLPGVIGIGPTKTGTSTLRDWLKVPVNAAVRIADGEPRFFNDPDTVLPNFFAEGLRSYRRRMPALNSSDDVDGLTIVEKSPHYFNFLSARVQDGAPARAARMCASMGLLVIVRDPVERAVSNYAMRVYEHENGRVKGPKPNEFEGEVLLPDGTVNEAHTYVQAGLYQDHLLRWLEYFPREQFLFLDFDEFRKRPYESLHSLEGFLEVAPAVKPEQFVLDEERGFYCFRHSPDSPTTCAGKDKGIPHPHVDPEVLDTLRKFYIARNAHLERITGLKLAWMQR